MTTINTVSNQVSATAAITTAFRATGINDIQKVQWISNGISITTKAGAGVTYTSANSTEAGYLQDQLEYQSGQGKTFAKVINAAGGKPQYVPFANVKNVAVTTADETGYQATVTLLDNETILTELTSDVSRINQFAK